MILDNETLFADDLAHDGTPETLDLETVRPGPGEQLRVFVTGSADLAGCTGISVLDAAVAPADEAVMTVTDSPTGKTIEFDLPSNILQFVTIALVGTTSAGTFTAGIVLPGNQTNL